MARRAVVKPETVTVITDNLRPVFVAAVHAIEALESESAQISADTREEYKSLKEKGLDTKAVRGAVKRRKISAIEREALQDRVDACMLALGSLADLPLGQAAAQAAGVAPIPQ